MKKNFFINRKGLICLLTVCCAVAVIAATATALASRADTENERSSVSKSYDEWTSNY